MAQEIHYEVYCRPGPKASWGLQDVAPTREAALEMAQALLADGRASSAKVTKETYSTDTGDYLSIKIFEGGHSQSNSTAAAEDLPHALSCLKPEDLYREHARATIARLLTDYLSHNLLTVTEFMHRADALQKFEATGTLFQHAIQKLAVAQAASTATPVQQIVRNLNGLVTEAIHRVYRDEHRGLFQKLEPGQFAMASQKFAGKSNGAYLLNGAIAGHLQFAKSWTEKIGRLLALTDEASGDAGGILLCRCLDSIAAEVLHTSVALHEMIGEHENLGSELETLTDLFMGEVRVGIACGGTLLALSKHFANDRLPAARMAVMRRILAELKSVRRLCPSSLNEEFDVVKRIAGKLVRAEESYLNPAELIAAFVIRSRRAIIHERIEEYLSDAGSPDDKLERLLQAENSIVGAGNKRRLASFIMPIIWSAGFESHFLFGRAPLLDRLRRLSALQARVLKSGFSDEKRAEIANVLDHIANELELRANLFDGIETRASSHVEKAIEVLSLCAGGVLTEGTLARRARDVILRYLGRPGFLSGYAMQIAAIGDSAPNPAAAMSRLMVLVDKAGIPPQVALTSLAA